MRNLIFNSLNKVRPLWRLVIFLSITFLINIPLQILLQSLMPQGFLRGYVSASIYLLSVLTSLYIQVKYLDKSSFKKYGLRINKIWMKEFSFGFLIPIIQLSLFFMFLYLTGNLTITNFFTTSSPDYAFMSAFVSEFFGLIIGSSVEEIFFRAFLFYVVYEALRTFKKDPVKRALIILFLIAPLFGIAHIDNTGATIMSTINLGLDAIIMCLPFLITGRLGMSIGMHLSWNFFQGAVFGFAISGNIAKASIMEISILDNLITGGTFGAEGSVLFILLDIIAFGLLLLWKKRYNLKGFVNPSIEENYKMSIV
ncbi:CPBP family intramembrane glutamic endopeptidase [uncultured Tenacibaculum sp.]|uniref:CPBP family intramembrane glutamic endopeptidase n=1 Tax=uncultured Tenacibaculum sp. TaxID=174713 RepID=UPI00260D793A|nr:CPBP family intramembrane glutamic endopeptidase [uncultured Tenacibaculum sp.]